MTTLAVDAAQAPRKSLFAQPPTLALTWCILAAELLLILIIQLPTVADFKKFAFYDEGAWLHLDALWAAGRTPTVDLGYSYGMLPLMLSRAWLALFGRTPWAYIAFVNVCNLIALWGLARILQSVGLTWQRLFLACVMLPHAIFVYNYSLMHPLELMLFILALAQLAQKRHAAALAFATAAVFTKPSMAYVLGFLILCFIFWQRKNWKTLIPAALTALALWGISILAVGWEPAYRNILPLTGGNSYKLMNFGILHAGKDFWWHPSSNPNDLLAHYLFSPATFWIIVSLLLWIVAATAVARLLRKEDRPTDTLLITIAALHAAFVFVFYAWAGSWTYYSYLPVLGLLIIFSQQTFRPWFLTAWVLISLCAAVQRFGWARDAWFWQRSSETAGLWTYPAFQQEFTQVRETIRAAGFDEKGESLYLVNGALSLFWPDVDTPPCWFVSPGLPTPQEMAYVKAQLDAAQAVVLFKEYDQNQEAWNWPEFREYHEQFTHILWEGERFRILQRSTPPDSR